MSWSYVRSYSARFANVIRGWVAGLNAMMEQERGTKLIPRAQKGRSKYTRKRKPRK